MNIQAVKDHIKYLKEDGFSLEFYTALMLYDIAGLEDKDITEEKINKAYRIQDSYDSIYNQDLRDEIRSELEAEQEYEEEMEK